MTYADGLGVDSDVVAAAGWYKAAASVGHVKAQCRLGVAYANGEGKVAVPAAVYHPRNTPNAPSTCSMSLWPGVAACVVAAPQ